MERSIFFLIIGLGIVYVIFSEIWGDKKYISNIANMIMGEVSK